MINKVKKIFYFYNEKEFREEEDRRKNITDASWSNITLV